MFSVIQACYAVLQSWVSKKFMTGCVVLFPVAVTFFVTWWIVQFFDGFFSPIYERLGVEIFGLGFLTSLIFIYFFGIFASSWMGATVFWVGSDLMLPVVISYVNAAIDTTAIGFKRRKKMLLAQAQEAGVILKEEQQDFLADGLVDLDSDGDDLQLHTTSIFKADHVDAFDSDCDEALTTSAIFMARLSPAGSINGYVVCPTYDIDMLSEVPHYDTHHDTDMLNPVVQET
ncbi:hypothetical protein Tco_1428497 [Tanacetum coccineum]